MKTPRILLFILQLTFVGAARAQTQLIATAERYQISLDERLRVSFACNANGRNFQSPDWGADWEVQMGPALSQSTTIIQGRVKSESAYQFIIRPKRKGTLMIGPARITIDGVEVSSKILNIEVLDSQSNTPGKAPAQKAPPAFFRLEPSRTSVYVGEPLMLDYTYYYQASVQQLGGDEKIQIKGFFSKDLEVPEAGKRGVRSIDGLNYQWVIGKRLMLIPQLKDARIEGYLELQGIDFSNARANDPFNWSYQRGRSFKERRNAPEISVKPLPEKGRPEGFSGAVGRFVLRAQIDKEELNSGEPIKLKIEVEGKGNLGLIELEEPELPAQIEAFEPERRDRLSVGSTGFSGLKSIEILLIPRHKGTYQIPPYRFAYFDPEKSEYVELTTGELSFEVLNGEQLPATSESTTAEDVQTVVEDIRYLRSPGRSAGHSELGLAWFLWLLLTPIIGWWAGTFKRNKGAFSTDAKRLLLAEGLKAVATLNPNKEFNSERALNYLERFQLEILELKASELSRIRGFEAMISVGYSADTAERFAALKEKLERLRFSGSSSKAEESDMRQNWIDVWTKL